MHPDGADFPVKPDARKLFSDLVAPHLGSAFHLARRLTNSAPDAEDIVQEASLRAFQAVSTSAVENPKAWFLSITRNVAYSTMARKKSNLLVLTTESEQAEKQFHAEPDSAATPEAQLLARADDKAVEAALTRLPPLLREVILLREFSDLSYKEIAQVTGAPIGTVMSRLARARGELMRILGHAEAWESTT